MAMTETIENETFQIDLSGSGHLQTRRGTQVFRARDLGTLKRKLREAIRAERAAVLILGWRVPDSWANRELEELKPVPLVLLGTDPRSLQPLLRLGDTKEGTPTRADGYSFYSERLSWEEQALGIGLYAAHVQAEKAWEAWQKRVRKGPGELLKAAVAGEGRG